ncbi:MAG: tetratricopeptide repeat protein, partial [Gemmatimonadales bacterium]
MAYQSEMEKLEQRFREKPEQWFAALADAYRKNGDLELALEILVTWIDKRPTYTSGYIVQGRCLLDKGDDPKAAGVFQKVLDLDPENIIALKSLGDIAQRGNDSVGAQEWLARLLEVDPMNEEAQEALEALGGPAEPPAAASPPPPPPPPPAPGLEPVPEEPADAMTSPMGLEPTPQFEGSAESSTESATESVGEEPPIVEPPAPTEFEATVTESEPPPPMGFEPIVTEAAPIDETEAEAEEDESVVIGEPAYEPAPIGLVETGPTDSPDENAGMAPPDDEAGEAPISLAPEPVTEESDVGH